MKMNLLKVSLAVLALGIVTGCGEKEAPAVVADAAPAVAETPAATPAAAVEPTPVNFAAYAAPANAPVAGGSCELDAINGAPAIGASAKVGDQVMFGGWIADANNQVPTDARIVLKGPDNSYSVPLVAGVERADVAAAYGADSLKLAGYNVLATLDVAPGTYELSIVHGPAEAPVACALKGSLAVAN